MEKIFSWSWGSKIINKHLEIIDIWCQKSTSDQKSSQILLKRPSCKILLDPTTCIGLTKITCKNRLLGIKVKIQTNKIECFYFLIIISSIETSQLNLNRITKNSAFYNLLQSNSKLFAFENEPTQCTMKSGFFRY